MKTVGIDIGGTQIKAGRLIDGVRAESERAWPTPVAQSPEVLIRQIAEVIAGLGEFEQIGVATAGMIDRQGGRICVSPNLPGWRNLDLAERLERELGLRPAVLNDANAFVLAESRLGAAREAGNSVIGITLGTGVGGGLLLGGRLWEGRNGFAGEPGHMTIDLDGPDCACGQRGCLESRIGTRAILGRYRELSDLRDRALDPKAIADRARAGERAAIETYRETGRILGIALAGLTHLLDPDLFVIGGGVSLAGDLLLEPARLALAGSVMQGPERAPEIRSAILGNSAGWIGAALSAADVGEAPR